MTHHRTRRFLPFVLVTAVALSGLVLGACDLIDPVHSPGERLFRDNCAKCHGRGGTGTAAYLGNNYADLTDDTWKQGGSEFAIQQVIRQGVFGEMPPNPQLSDQEVKELATYVLTTLHRSESR
jgi:mono/diheme cytochrome c family protein